MRDVPQSTGQTARMQVEIDPTGMLPYQVPVAQRLLGLLQTSGAALDGSDMGTGKTFTATSIARSLALPTLVVCPQISITAWNRAAAAMGTEFDVLNYEMLRMGTTPFGEWENPRKRAERFYECTECQLKVKLDEPFRCPHHHLGIHCLREKSVAHEHGKFFWNPAVKFIIFDEVHRCGGMDSLNSDMLVAAKRQGIKVLGLSATVADTPLNFRGLGYVLGLHQLVGRENSFYQWANRKGCRKSPFGGLAFTGNDNFRRIKMQELHEEVFVERGARIRISDLPPGVFPSVQITAELYDLKESGRIDELYAEMDDAVQELNERKLQDKNLEHPLTRVLRAKQEIELLKVPLFEEVVRSGLENGRTIGVFVNFSQTIEALCKRLKTDCRIDGTQIGAAGHARRQAIIDRVQADEERVIILNNQAGGVSISLQDLTGRFPRLGAVSLPNSASMFRQLCGRFPRAGGKSPSLYRIILAAGTVEEKLHKRLAEKLDQMDVLNDGDLWSANIPLKKHSLEQLTASEQGV